MAKKRNNEIKKTLGNGVSQADQEQAEETPEQTVTEHAEEAKTKKIKILKVVCRPEGTFLPNRVYEIDSSLADKLIASGNAKEEQ